MSRKLEVTEPRDRVVKLGLTLRPLKRGNLRGESVETEEAAMLEHREEEAAMWDAEGFKYKASSISSEDPPFLYCFLELRALNHM